MKIATGAFADIQGIDNEHDSKDTLNPTFSSDPTTTTTNTTTSADTTTYFPVIARRMEAWGAESSKITVPS